MEQYIVWILLAVCVGAHFWMMRKMRHGGHGHDDHSDKKDGEHQCCHDNNKKVS